MPNNNRTVLLVEPSEERRRLLQAMLLPAAGRLLAVTNRRQALRALAMDRVAVIVTAAKLPDGGWQDFLSHLAPLAAPPCVIVLESSDRRSPERARGLGGYAFLTEPLVGEHVQRVVQTAAEEWACRYGAPDGHPGKRQVLIVDDEQAVLHLIARILGSAGFEVLTAEKAEAAFDAVRRNPGIELAILDWRMPGMPGERVLDLLTAIRPDIRAIVISGDDLCDVARAFASRSVEQFLQKPLTARALETAVATALAPKSLAAGSR